ncbi:peptidyl-prolyl cis-trans isomerase FKBP1B-like [Cebus imitator]|uniref:peptidyl-prolyl cis-trans isomerase FKBP1B-like n=1 Tax=Cebus imitator TaxID=2715852 RepID=UPI001896D47B|nr:peptidyl-prolyl cis-trans isomerase FKBP1B-like [Cebus imitator]
MIQHVNKFDLSQDRNKPFKFKIGEQEVINDFEEYIVQMSLGKKVKLTCIPDVAYGAPGYSSAIPPSATLSLTWNYST